MSRVRAFRPLDRLIFCTPQVIVSGSLGCGTLGDLAVPVMLLFFFKARNTEYHRCRRTVFTIVPVRGLTVAS